VPAEEHNGVFSCASVASARLCVCL
jgi:hypothetical protein